MKFRNVLLAGLIMLLGLTAMAQDYPKIEVAVDYSYARYNPSHAYTKNGHSLNGAGGSVTFNFNKYMGIKAELTGYGSNTQNFVVPAGNPLCPSESACTLSANGNLFTYLFGPQVGLRSGRIRPFGHLLLGAAHSNLYTNLYKVAGIGNSNPAGNTFAMVFGGGVDIPVNKSGSIAIRPGEIDYLYTRFNNSATGAQSSLRYQAGVVFNF